MKKFPKKLLGILMAVVMLATTFSVIPVNAANTLGDKAKGTSTVMDFEGFTGHATEKEADTVMGRTDNITLENSSVVVSLVTRNLSDTAQSKQTDAPTTWYYATHPAIMDGKVGAKTECSYISGFNKILEIINESSGVRSANTSKKYAIDVVVDLGAEADIKGILLSSTDTCAIGDYDMYAGNNADVFTGTLIGQYTVDMSYWSTSTPTNAERQSLGLEAWKTKSGSTISARYIGFRIYISNTSANKLDPYYFDRIRLNEIAVYGEYNEEPGDGYYIVKGTSDTMSFKNVAATTTSRDTNEVMGLSMGENLTQGNANVSFDFVTTNVSDATQSKKSDNAVTYNATQYAAMIDGICGAKLEMPANYQSGFSKIMADYDGNTYTPNTSKKYAIDVTVDIGNVADISGVLISSSFAGLIGDYQLFASTDKNSLFTGAPSGEYKVNLDYFLDASRSENDRKNYGINVWKIKSGKSVSAQYIGFRIFITNISVRANSEYYYHDRVRLNEIAVYGKYEGAYHDYSVTSTHGDLNITGNTWEGRELTFSAPTITGAYMFKHWTVNGQVVAGTQSEDGTTFTIKTPITSTTNQIVAVYEVAQLDITSDVYDIDRINKILYLPFGTFGVTAFKNFDNHKDILQVKNKLGKVISTTDRLGTGMNIRVNVEGGESLDIITIGDSNLDGVLTVTDLVKTTYAVVGGALNGREKIAADTDHNGVITVTDAVMARNDLLNDKTLESYTKKTVTLNQIDYKVVGRKNIANKNTNNETVVLTYSSAGFVFNANALGSVELNVKGNANDYVTVTVDGVEIDRTLGVSSGNVVVAEDLEPGIHEIGIYTQREGQTLQVLGATFYGESSEIKDDDLTIEFIGDSISAAYGNLWNQTLGIQYNNDRHQNAFWGYGAIIGRELKANYSLIATSGSVLIDDPRCTNASSMQKVYTAKARNGSEEYDFASNPVDITFVSLGGNDCKVLPYMFDTEAEQVSFFKEQAKTFARTIVSKNGPNAKVVFWQSGGLEYATYRADHYANANPPEAKAVEGYNSIRKAYTQAVEELAKEGITAYLAPDTPCDIRGLYIHPLIDGEGGHKDIARILVDFLKEEVLDD